MVKKIQKTAATGTKKKGAGKAAAPITAASIKDQAQQIWTAGLGALAKAKGERNKAFEALMTEGAKLQKKTQAAAEETISAVTSKASQQFDKLETIFEDRVAKALSRLGVPSAKEVAALSKRVDALAAALKGGGSAKVTVAKPAAAKKPAANAPVAKKATAKPATKPAAKPAAKAPAKKATAAAAKPVAAKKPAAKKAAAPAAEAAAQA